METRKTENSLIKYYKGGRWFEATACLHVQQAVLQCVMLDVRCCYPMNIILAKLIILANIVHRTSYIVNIIFDVCQKRSLLC